MSKEVESQSLSRSTGNPNPPKPVAEEKVISFLEIFRYLSSLDFFWMLVGTIGAIAHGACWPLSALLFGEIINSLGPTAFLDNIIHSAEVISLKFIYLGLASFVTGYFGYSCWVKVSEKASNEIRKRYFKALLQQEMDFIDSISLDTLSSKFSEECFNIQQGMGAKVPIFLQVFSSVITGLIIAFSKDWTLSLVLLGFYTIMQWISGSINPKKDASAIDARAETIFGEALNGIRTVSSFSGEQKEIERYDKTLQENDKMISKSAVLAGISGAFRFLASGGLFPLAVCFDSFFITGNTRYRYPVGDLYIVLLSLQSSLIDTLLPFSAVKVLETFTAAKLNAAKAFAIIERSSQISLANEKGLKPSSCKGLIKFRDVKFPDPQKQDRNILNGVSFDLRPNEITAFVGKSDSGKNTCLKLIERIHDIENGKGSIFLDGNELKEINKDWLRENISYIGQEPVLFALSIKENLLMAKEDATDAEIWDALAKVNAADFVQGLPDKLDTLFSRSDTSFSGAQKQRLAIARALLKNPAVLLLDDFTKDLDRNDETEILKTILEISQGRTTILATDRLSATINADHIIVFEEGKVAEEGNHEQLIVKQEKYYAQFQNQGQVEPPKIIEEEKPRFASHSEEEEDRLLDDESSLKEPLIASNASENKISQIALFKRLLNYSKDDLPLLIIESIASIFRTCYFTAKFFLFSSMINILGDPHEFKFSSRSGFFLKLSIVNTLVAFIADSVMFVIFRLTHERLRKRIRKDMFRKLIRMPVRWFDEPANSPQVIQDKLSTDILRFNGMIIFVFSTLVMDFSFLILLLAISFVADWRIASLALACSPLLILSLMMRERLSKEKTEISKDAYQESHVFASEVIKSKRTVASFCKEQRLLQKFSEKLFEPEKIAIKTAYFSSLSLGGRDLLNLVFYAITFYFGAIVMKYYQIGFFNLFLCIMAMVNASLPISKAFERPAHFRLCQKAVIDVFHILDTKPTIDIGASNQTRTTPIIGNIEFKNVWFKYPNKGKQILKNFNLKIQASKKTALVGPSGCGKSAILDLIQRYYDVDSGEILIDGVNMNPRSAESNNIDTVEQIRKKFFPRTQKVKQYNLEHLRESFGVISKEPVLFNGTIASNIKYGKEEANAEEVREAAAKANALDFIESSEFNAHVGEFDAGFKRKVGSMGAKLPYSQKQRIAIARAILKNPSVLILDEVTCDLDDENEKAVQKALDQIVKDKTSIIATSEISTVKDADEIIVLNGGQIIKRGSYGGLMAMKGI